MGLGQMLVPDLSQTGAVYWSEKSNRDMESSHANIFACVLYRLVIFFSLYRDSLDLRYLVNQYISQLTC